MSKYSKDGCNAMHSVEDLPGGKHEKAAALEWLARKVWHSQIRFDGETHCKSYDPLVIEFDNDDDDSESGEAHSYVLELRPTSGRHYRFSSLDELEEMLERALDYSVGRLILGADDNSEILKHVKSTYNIGDGD